ncbi:hypothetical protein CVT24_006650 [Panaeolus cyanescens]|uniref:CxC1-like cysteine cluster associated with KDZ transposases domain-containing protein n=1 Tax=Panaeolus cyanescens TaxID=181874 RepID=A0A409YSI7_9AGAR|nr:hypothetical protein CVT24_006650 [Panaeolus cyanescens]
MRHNTPSIPLDNSDDAWEDVTTFSSTHNSRQILEGLLAGRVELDLSHHGGEFEELVRYQLDSVNPQKKKKRKHDNRSRQDAIEKRVAAFAVQLSEMVKAYLCWSMNQGDRPFVSPDAPTYDGESERPEGVHLARKLDVFGVSNVEIRLYKSLPSIAASFVREGLIPCAPEAPTVGFTIRTLELFRTASLCCPHLSTQGFVKSISDLQGYPYKSYLSKQFSIAYDSYLDILNAVEKQVNHALGRDSDGWRLGHACAPCTYKLQGEPPLKYSMFVTMDGNDSLKRLAHREQAEEVEGEKRLGVNHERADPRVVDGDYYLSREEVDRWSQASLSMIPTKTEETDPNACDDHWKNMANERTARMWGSLTKLGYSSCYASSNMRILRRPPNTGHSHVLMVMDMVRSGEQSKYALAAVQRLLDAFGSNIGIGYDIGCKFGTTLRNSPLGPRAAELQTTCLVGSFHGHTHNRQCQLKNLTTYVDGVGLEDLEGCEPFFSKSNTLAASTRHASIYHRRQKINAYIKHTDVEDTYLGLSSLLVNGYKHALDIISQEDLLLTQMQRQGLGKDTSIFRGWLDEESHYLSNLTREPVEETLKMEYYERLQSFYKIESILTEAQTKWNTLTPSTINKQPDSTLHLETKRRQLIERHQRELEVIHNLELQLEIKPEDRWIPDDDEWKEAKKMVSLRRYQAAVDRLEGLVVARLFELTKANMSQTGYKMRQHIGKALKARSQAIRTALNDYNVAAKAVKRTELTWDQVVQYSQLADFDLLSDTCEDVRQHLWASPSSRTTLDLHFKILRAREEITRLDVEIRRLTTYIRDEEAFLAHHSLSLQHTQPSIAHQIQLRLLSFKRKNDIHITRLMSLLKLPGFTGTLDEGISIENPHIPPPPSLRPSTSSAPSPDFTAEENEQEEEEEEEEAEQIAFQVMELSVDDK